jgi:4-amino-4-deoxy-L-arabinose transferase-like glycosyltransferase
MSDGLALAARVVGIAVGFPLLAWAFGSAVLARFTRLDREERFAAGFGLGFAAVAVCAFLAFVLHAPQPYFNLGAVAVMLGTALLCRLTTATRPAENGPSLWPLAAVFALAYLHLVSIQALLPVYRGSYWYFDWWMHYDEALVFVGDRAAETSWGHYTLASRTPLFNLATAFVMGVAGHGFDVYQLASATTNICFVLSLYVLLRDLFGRRAAWLALLLAPLNLWMLHNAWFTWPKMLAAYYLVLGLYFYLQSLRRRRTEPARAAEYFFGFAASSLLGFMTHQVGLVYVVPLLLHAAVMAFRNRAYRPRLSELLAGTLVALAVGGPWYAWLAGTLGKDKITGSTPVTLGDASAQFRPAAIAGWMGFNLLVSVVPAGLGEAFVSEAAPDADVPPWSVEVYRGEKRWLLGLPNLVALHRGLTQLYFSLLTGALTISLVVFLARAGVRRLRHGPALPPAKTEPAGPVLWSAVWLFLVGGTLGAAFLHPGKIPWGIAHSAAFPSAVVLTALAWGLLSRARRAAVALVCCGMVLEFVLMFWSHWWLLNRFPEVLEGLPGNASYKDQTVVFLNDRIGEGQYAFLIAAALVQAALIGLLFLSPRWRAETAGEVTR